jgi:hypothetical protein
LDFRFILDWINETYRLYRNYERFSYTQIEPVSDGATMTRTAPRTVPISRRGTSAMAKSYNEQLAEWVKQRAQSARHEKNRVAFLSVKKDVREALEQGWPVKTIWAHMVEQKRIGFGYNAFLIYVNRHVRSVEKPAVGCRTKGTLAPPLAPACPPPPGSVESKAPRMPVLTPPAQDQLPGFTFNAAPKREELI